MVDTGLSVDVIGSRQKLLVRLKNQLFGKEVALGDFDSFSVHLW